MRDLYHGIDLQSCRPQVHLGHERFRGKPFLAAAEPALENDPATRKSRKLGVHVLTEKTQRRQDVGPDSYQDTLPANGFGNDSIAK